MKKKGFTIIEVIVVIAVVGLTLPVMFSIFFVLFQQQTKVYRLNSIKKEGDYIIRLVENNIKDNATMILRTNSPIPPDDTNKVCFDDLSSYSSTTSLYFLDENSAWFGYTADSRTIASDSANLAAAIDLTSSKILISNFSVSCSRTYTFSQPLVLLSFDICYDSGTGDCNSSRPEEVASLHYQTRIKLRNY